MWFRILVLALGTFAVGTDSFVIAGILPDIAQGLHITLSLAGIAVTVFALVYAFGAPVFASLAGAIERRRLLLLSLTVLGIANILAALSPNFAFLLAARILAALGAAFYTPTASAVAAALVPAQQRGRALALVMTGLTVATVLGVPLGIMIGSWLNWQATLIFVAILCALAFVGIAFLFPHIAPAAVVSLRTRLAFLKRRSLLFALLHTLLYMGGVQIVITYLRPLLQQITHIDDVTVSTMLLLFGLAGVGGGFIGGYGSDRWGSMRTIIASLVLLTAILFVFPWAITTLVGAAVALVIWGAVGWAIAPAQQHRLIAFAPEQAGIVLSLNSSALYLGVSCGSILSSLLIQHTELSTLCLVASGWEATTLVLVLLGVFLGQRIVKNGAEKENLQSDDKILQEVAVSAGSEHG